MSEQAIRCSACGALNVPGAEDCQACGGILLDVSPPPPIGSTPYGSSGYGNSEFGNSEYGEFDTKPGEYDPSLRFILPVGRSGLAIAAGYLGLFSLIVFPAPIALIVGILAVRDLRMNPKKLGMGRAVFGIIAGGLGSVALLFILGAMLFRR